MAKTALVPLAEGAEEMETVIIVDVLRRAGVEVTLAGVDGPSAVRCSRGVLLMPDTALSDVSGNFDVIVLPGGAGGAARLCTSSEVGRRLQAQEQRSALIGAVCAAPIALHKHRIGLGKRVTSHPSVRADLEAEYLVVNEVVADAGNLVTSQGPGTSFEFALTLVSKLLGPEKAEEVRAPMRIEI